MTPDTTTRAYEVADAAYKRWVKSIDPRSIQHIVVDALEAAGLLGRPSDVGDNPDVKAALWLWAHPTARVEPSAIGDRLAWVAHTPRENAYGDTRAAAVLALAAKLDEAGP